MPSLIDIRRRIRSVKSTQQITRAMKLVSSAKLRRAQDRVLSARPYSAILARLLADVARAARSDERLTHPLLAERPERRIQLILITADRGLAGAFNSNLIKAAQQFLAERQAQPVEVETIGRKGRDFFRKRNATLSGEHVGLTEKVTYPYVAGIAAKVMARFAAGEIDAVYVLYNEFKSVIPQRMVVERISPSRSHSKGTPSTIFTSNRPRRYSTKLIPRYVEVQVYRALLESTAAEHGARMTAMEAATNNASDMIEH